MKRTLADAAAVAGGRLAGEDRAYDSVSTDSRTLEPRALFVALRGPNFDGAQFVTAALERGAAGAVVSRPVAARIPQVIVADTLRALQSLAAGWRAQFDLPVVAVAGSNGKTTTKEMIAGILGLRGECLATRGNLNNHIGVPLTLMRLRPAHRSAVIELGANRIGEVAELVQWVKPAIAVLTNAGAEHLEGFGDLDGVAKGEGEVFGALGADGVAVINADDPYADYWRGQARGARIVTFGLGEGADFGASNPVRDIESGHFAARFDLRSPLGTRPISLQAAGTHNIRNALAAAAAAAAVGASLEDIAAGLLDFRPVPGRLQLKAGIGGSRIIDDSYNANPSSVRAGIEVLRSLGGTGWLVLGEMGELGAHAGESHVEIGRYARASGVARLFAVGTESTRAVEAFGTGGEWFADCDALIRRLHSLAAAGVTILVKGSRINRLERVVKALSVDAEATGAAAGGS